MASLCFSCLCVWVGFVDWCWWLFSLGCFDVLGVLELMFVVWVGVGGSLFVLPGLWLCCVNVG